MKEFGGLGSLDDQKPDSDILLGTDQPTPGMQAITGLYNQFGLPDLGLVSAADYREFLLAGLRESQDLLFIMNRNHPIAAALRILAEGLDAGRLGQTTVNTAAEIVEKVEQDGDFITTFSYIERLGTEPASARSLTIVRGLQDAGEYMFVSTRAASGEVNTWQYLIPDDRNQEAVQIVPSLVGGIATMEQRQIQTAVGALPGVDGIFVTRAAQL